ncbi:MAG: ribonuclease III domain-containing protein [Candidatus Thorarchaeota archaeon]
MTGELYWEPIDIVSQLNELITIVKESAKDTPRNNTRSLQKFRRWTKELRAIIKRVKYVEETIAVDLSRIFGIALNERGLLSISLFQPSTKNLFLELYIHYCTGNPDKLDCTMLNNLAGLGEMAKVLALVGDASIDIAVLHHLWKPNAADVGSLTQDRADIVSNEHLALKCDEFGLYDNRIHLDPLTTISGNLVTEHIKGTLVEALYGVIYIEYGFEKVKETIKHIIG